MSLETGTYISDLVATNPTANDPKSEGDDHMRLIKSTIQNTFPNIDGEVTPTQAELNILDGVTVSAEEINYLEGVTSPLQEQLGTQVSSLAELRALDGAVSPVGVRGRSLPLDGGYGTFDWDSSDRATEVTEDTQSGVYVAPNSDLTGASGVWVRRYSGSVNVLWFLANPIPGISAMSVGFQAALDFTSTREKRVFTPAGVYGIETQIQFPADALTVGATPVLTSGIELYGVKDESSYDWTVGTHGTTLKALGAMDSMITCRDGLTSVMAVYSKIKNLVLNGNNLATYGWINGGQDKFSDSTVYNCAGSGILLQTFTNSTHLENVTSVANQQFGAVLDGDFSTVSVWDKCNFRGNGLGGVQILSSIGARFSDCIFENNLGPGTRLFRSVSTPEQQILNIKFDKCYWEQNDSLSGGYQIAIGGLDATTLPRNISFEMAHINSGSNGRLGVSLTFGDDILFDEPLFTGDNLVTPGWFNLASTIGAVRIGNVPDSTIDPSNMTIDGPGVFNLRTGGNKKLGTIGTYLDKPFNVDIIRNNDTAGFNKTFTGSELANTVISNNGQAVGSATVKLPLPTEGFEALFVIEDISSGSFYAIDGVTPADPKILLNGVLVQYVINSPVTLGAAVRLIALPTSGLWLAEPVAGLWVNP